MEVDFRIQAPIIILPQGEDTFVADLGEIGFKSNQKMEEKLKIDLY